LIFSIRFYIDNQCIVKRYLSITAWPKYIQNTERRNMKMKKQYAGALLATFLLVTTHATPASAMSGNQTSSSSQVAPTMTNFSDSSGAIIDTYQFELDPNSGSVSLYWSDRSGLSRAAWGGSYATSTEIAWLYYVGKARAAGNVYQGKRIISVCIWYSRANEIVSDAKCSNATSNSVAWFSGPEVRVDAYDSLDWNATPTIFNIRTTRIDPTLFP
jgi:hypothetical protein